MQIIQIKKPEKKTICMPETKSEITWRDIQGLLGCLKTNNLLKWIVNMELINQKILEIMK